MHLNYLLTRLLNLFFLILGHCDIEGFDIWSACHEPYYGADDVQYSHYLKQTYQIGHHLRIEVYNLFLYNFFHIISMQNFAISFNNFSNF